MDQYDLLLKLSEDIRNIYTLDKSVEVVELVKKIASKIHALRYRMAYNKATDSGVFDAKLKQAWEELNKLQA